MDAFVLLVGRGRHLVQVVLGTHVCLLVKDFLKALDKPPVNLVVLLLLRQLLAGWSPRHGSVGRIVACRMRGVLVKRRRNTLLMPLAHKLLARLPIFLCQRVQKLTLVRLEQIN